MGYISEARDAQISPVDAQLFEKTFKRSLKIFWSGIDHFKFEAFSEAFDLPAEPDRMLSAVRTKWPDAFGMVERLTNDGLLARQ